MSKDQLIGILILLGSIAGIILYFYLDFLSAWTLLTMQITAFIAVGGILVILAWIGYTLATTPPPEPIEELEKELGEEPEEEPKEKEEK